MHAAKYQTLNMPYNPNQYKFAVHLPHSAKKILKNTFRYTLFTKTAIRYGSKLLKKLLSTDFFKKSIWTSMASVSYGAYALVATKLVSLYYGPQGLTFFNHFQNLCSLYHAVPADGLSRANIKMLASGSVADDKRGAYFGTVLTWLGLAYLITTLLIVCLIPLMHPEFVALFDFATVCALGVGMLLQMLVFVVVGYFMAMQHIKTYALLSITNNGFAIGLMYIFSSMSERVFFIAVCYGVSLVLLPAFLLFYNKEKLHNRNMRFTWWNRVYAKQIWDFIGLSIAAYLLNKLVDWLTRAIAINAYSMDDVGYWQAVSKLSDGYSNIFNAAFGLLFFTKASSLLHDMRALRSFTVKTSGMLFAFSAILLGMVYFLRSEVIHLLFSPAFALAERMFLPQCLADVFKFPSWLFGFILLSRGKLKAYFWLQVLSHGLFFIGYGLLYRFLGVDALLWANALRFILYFLSVRYYALQT